MKFPVNTGISWLSETSSLETPSSSGESSANLTSDSYTHVAEEAATLDVLTGGNYILGIGLVIGSRSSTPSASASASGCHGLTKAST
jgi:hypothetical protein